MSLGFPVPARRGSRMRLKLTTHESARASSNTSAFYKLELEFGQNVDGPPFAEKVHISHLQMTNLSWGHAYMQF